MYNVIYFKLGISVRHSIKKKKIWRHEKCSFILHKQNLKRCTWCERISTAFRIKKHHILQYNRVKRISSTLTPNRAKTLSILKKVKHNIQKSNSR